MDKYFSCILAFTTCKQEKPSFEQVADSSQI